MTHTPTTLDRLQPQHAMVTTLQHSVRRTAADVLAGPATAALRPRTAAVAPSAEIAAIDAVAGPHALTAGPDTDRGLDAVLAGRSSERFYAETPVDPTVVAEIVRAGLAADTSGWPGEHEAGLDLELLVAARRMTGAQPALYRLAGDVFEPLAPLDEGSADDLVLQIEYAWSPVILIAVVPFAASLDRWGDHGERVVNTRAAAAVTAALHRAASLGLVGSPFAGFLTSGLRRLLDVDGYANAQLFAASFGHPVELAGVDG